MESKKSGFAVAQKIDMELGYINMLTNNYLNNWLGKWYHNSDREYYVKQQDLICENQWYDHYTGNKYKHGCLCMMDVYTC